MENRFFEQPILNSPYLKPTQHWELDSEGQPTQEILASRRPAEFVTPVPKPKKRKKSSKEQEGFIFDEGSGLSSQ
jgi:type III restriction enzyme